MSHKQSVLSFFPNSTIQKGSKSGYMAIVVSDKGNVLLSEYGQTAQEAWRNVYVRIYEIWSVLLSTRAATSLLMNGNPDPN